MSPTELPPIERRVQRLEDGTVVVHSLACYQGAPFEPPLRSSDPDWALHAPAVEVDKKDGDTPDQWVPRDPRILRLTGRHPLNCEPPMDVLMSYGFITPPSIHIVRNHGAVPRIRWEDHRIEINGLVDKPMTLTMDQLMAMPAVTVPVTVVCAGNRRKEENMLKKSIGFNWGPCAAGTTYWTGVRLRDVLQLAGIKSPEEGANFVSFRGPKGELPKGEDGSYGTSLTYTKAMDFGSDVLLAYKQNGRWLLPDHGFPVRMLIPGFIGGRMVKYLSEITVTEKESSNFYHYYDNRVIPSHVDEELAKKEGWWFKPDFIINDLNINSAVAKPWHDEIVSLQKNEPYTVRGYAYSGGGRKIIRCEISLDDGKTWRLAEIRRFEKPNSAGKYWCWVHWDIQVMTYDFLTSPTKELLCRAWDESMNTQPAMITWNVMGMMNNCYFRIKIHPQLDEAGNLGLRFQHPAPVEVGEQGNIGWREEDNLKAQALLGLANLQTTAALPSVPAAPAPAGAKTYTMEEVAQHNTEESCWFVHEGKVYDGTPFLEDHPGGAESILIVGGMDATEDFNAIHSAKAKAMLKDYYLGELVASKPDAPATPSTSGKEAAAANGNGAIAITANGSTNGHAANGNGVVANGKHANGGDLVTLNPREKISLTMMERIELNHDTRIYRFALPSPQHKLGLPVGKHLFVYATVDGESVMRAYTPVSGDDEEDRGKLDLLIKVYFKGQNTQYPEGGKMSQHLDSLKVGDSITVKGPLGHFVYEGQGRYTSHGKVKGVAKHLSMLAGGTGITPIWQVMKAILKDPSDPTTMSLVFANRFEHDILLREEIDAMAAAHPDRLKVWYVLSKPGDTWGFGKGHVTEELMRERLHASAPDGSVLGLMCGPPGLLEQVGEPAFTAMGYKKEHLVIF